MGKPTHKQSQKPTKRKRRFKQGAQHDASKYEQNRSSSKPAAGIDKPLLYVTIGLSLVGLMTLFSASASDAMAAYNNGLYFVTRQSVFFILGFAMMAIISRFPFFYWNRLAKPLALVVIGLLAYTLMSGVEVYGAERWIRIFGIQFQPSELGKIATILLLAQALRDRSDRINLNFVINIGLIAGMLILILKQPNLSMTIILSSVTGALLFISGFPLLLLGAIGAAGGAVVVTKIMHTEYQLKRIQGWLDPYADPQGTGWNLIQSLYAIGSGGLIGRGLGASYQKLSYLPFQNTDFIFSIFAEEWGFLGCLVLIGLYILLLYRGHLIAKNCPSTFGQLLAMGITLMLGLQVAINLSVTIGLMPVTGVTLPLISYGGTSVVITLMMIGILLNISTYRATISPLKR